MRRPINWVVFGLSLLFLFANMPLSGRKSREPMIGPITLPAAAEVPLSASLIVERAPPEFGYVRDDGSFVPLVQHALDKPGVDAGAALLEWSSPVASPKAVSAF